MLCKNVTKMITKNVPPLRSPKPIENSPTANTALDQLDTQEVAEHSTSTNKKTPVDN